MLSTDIMLLQNNSTPGNLTAASFQKFDKLNMPVLNLTFGTDHVVCGDLQGDGLPELIVTRAGSTRNSVHIFRNTTVGTTLNFAAVPPLLLDIGHFATRLVLRDLNRDGKPEIIVTNSFNDQLYIFINQSSAGTLSFNPTPMKLSIKINPGDVLTTYEASVVDLNGDNLPEIVINQFQTNDLYILRNQSTGSINFAAPQKIDLPGGLNRLTSADFNSDGKSDLVVTSTLNNRIDVLLNQTAAGATTFAFASSISMATATGPWGVDVSDIDGDGDIDITVANRNQTTIDIFLNNGNFGALAFTKTGITTDLPTRNIRIGDLDGDGKPDIAYTAFNNATKKTEVGILRNTCCYKPKIENPQPLVICNGQNILLTTKAAPNVAFAWTKDGAPIGGNNPYLNITAPGVYQVTATGEGGACVTASDAVTVTNDTNSAPPTPTITANSPLCIGGTLNLQTTAVPGATYLWTGPNDFTSSVAEPAIASVTDDHAGVYALQIMVGVCKSEIATKRVDIARLADFNITAGGATTVCAGSNVALTVNSQAAHSYQWRKDGADIAGQTATTLNAAQEGQYTVLVTNTTLNCEVETPGVTVTIMAPPVAAWSADLTACTNETIAFTDESQSDSRATVLYNWNFGDGPNVTAQNPTHAYTVAQTYNASLTVNYQGVSGCSDNETKAVTIVEGVTPVINATAADACPDEQVTLTLAGTFASVIWSNEATANVIDVLPGTYTVNTVDANGCAGQAEVMIAEKEVPELVASANPATIGAGSTTQLSATGADTYAWTPVDNLDDPSSATPVATPQETTTYRVTGTGMNGCAAIADVLVTIAGVAKFPVAFTPNSDGRNDTWEVNIGNNGNCILTVFDARGRRIFESSGENWDGTWQGKAVPEGTYYYVYGCPDQKPVTGNVLLFR